jgi:hypothetical protein
VTGRGAHAAASRSALPLEPPPRRPRVLPVLLVVLLLAAGIAVGVKYLDTSPPPCQNTFVPAFFPPPDWSRAVDGNVVPGVMILNPASGPGPSPDSALQGSVSHARDKGSTVIGYIGTEYGARPLAQAEQYVRSYHSWYAVTGIFLDQTPTEGTRNIGYYRSLAGYIHRIIPNAMIWLNPGAFPDRAYMSVGNVVMVFEGPYQSYLNLRVPDWVSHYRPGRFAHTVYATPAAAVANAVRLSRDRNAGYLYLTDDVGSNPYSALPEYWSHEQAAIAGGCSRS